MKYSQFILVMILLSTPALGAEPASQPSTAEQNLIRTSQTSGAGSANDPLSPGRIAWSLAIVLVLIIVLRLLARRFIPGHAHRNSGAFQVLLRMPISPRQQALIVQIGRRLLVVGDSGQQMNTLCEITDPDEIAEILSQIQAERPRSIFPKPQQPHAEPPDPDMATTRAELSGLLSKVQTMASQFKPN